MAKSQTDPGLFSRWQHYNTVQSRFSHYAKSSGRFTRTGAKTNTYVLFTELAADIGTHAGMIVKSGISTDAAQSPVWKRLLRDGRVREVTDMVNVSPSGAPVFPAVAVVERFSIVAIGPEADTPVSASLMNRGVAEARASAYRTWSEADLAAVAPRTRTLLSSGDADELDLALELQHRFRTLDFEEEDGKNPWALTHATLFNSTYAKRDGLLLRDEALVRDGFVLQADRTFRHPARRVAVPVYEGQMANRWDHRARTFEGFQGANKYGKKPDIPWTTELQHANQAFELEPRYWMDRQVSEDRLAEVAGDDLVLAMRDVGAVWTNRRTMRVAFIGRRPTTHTLPVLLVERSKALVAATLFNSMTFDFLVRLHMPGGHVTPWILSQCAAPQPQALPASAGALAEELSITSLALAEMTGLAAHQWSPERRPLIDARLDALVAQAYQLDRTQYEIVLDHFQVLRRAEEADLGEYRSKRLRLEAFDDLGGSA